MSEDTDERILWLSAAEGAAECVLAALARLRPAPTACTDEHQALAGGGA